MRAPLFRAVDVCHSTLRGLAFLRLYKHRTGGCSLFAHCDAHSEGLAWNAIVSGDVGEIRRLNRRVGVQPPRVGVNAHADVGRWKVWWWWYIMKELRKKGGRRKALKNQQYLKQASWYSGGENVTVSGAIEGKPPVSRRVSAA